MHSTVNPPHSADDFRVAGMPDQDDLTTLVRIALALNVHLRDQRASGVNNRQPAVTSAYLDRAGNTVCAEDRDAALRDLVDLVDEMRTFGAQPLDDMPVVNDFMTYINRWAILFERTLDDLDCAFDPRAEPARLG